MLEMMRVELRVSTFTTLVWWDKGSLGRPVEEPCVEEFGELEKGTSEKA